MLDSRTIQTGISDGETQTPDYLALRISQQTFYRWKKKFAGLGVAEVRRLKLLDEKNKKLTALVADLSLDKQNLLSNSSDSVRDQKRGM